MRGFTLVITLIASLFIVIGTSLNISHLLIPNTEVKPVTTLDGYTNDSFQNIKDEHKYPNQAQQDVFSHNLYNTKSHKGEDLYTHKKMKFYQHRLKSNGRRLFNSNITENEDLVKIVKRSLNNSDLPINNVNTIKTFVSFTKNTDKMLKLLYNVYRHDLEYITDSINNYDTYINEILMLIKAINTDMSCQQFNDLNVLETDITKIFKINYHVEKLRHRIRIEKYDRINIELNKMIAYIEIGAKKILLILFDKINKCAKVMNISANKTLSDAETDTTIKNKADIKTIEHIVEPQCKLIDAHRLFWKETSDIMSRIIEFQEVTIEEQKIIIEIIPNLRNRMLREMASIININFKDYSCSICLECAETDLLIYELTRFYFTYYANRSYFEQYNFQGDANKILSLFDEYKELSHGSIISIMKRLDKCYLQYNGMDDALKDTNQFQNNGTKTLIGSSFSVYSSALFLSCAINIIRTI